MPAITILIAPIRLRSTDRTIVPIRLRFTDACTVLLPELISSAPICLWNYDLLTRPRADMPASPNPSLAPYCYYNRPLLPCLQLIDYLLLCLQPTDFYCFHLQLNQHLAAFLQRHKHK